MKNTLASAILLFTTVLVVNAQSGRRISGPPSPAPTPVVIERTEATRPTSATPSAGYSESLPNSPRSISVRDRKQNKPKETKSDDASKANSGNATSGEDEVLKVETNLVTVPVSVFDRQGLFVSDLIQKDFTILENGVEQEVAYFGTSEQPFTVVLLIDVSPSTEYKIEQIQQAAIAFVDMLKPQDKVIVIQFDQQVSQLCDATTDREKIRKAISRTGFGGGTSLYGAVDYTLNKALKKITGRKAVILFTDGVDTTSFLHGYEDTVRDAEESDSIIYPIYFNTYLSMRGIGGGGGVMSTPPTIGFPGGGGGGVFGGRQRGASREEYARGKAYLTELAAATGGKVYSAESNQLMSAFEGIADELRYQYSIGYYPRAEGKTGEVRQIRVRVYRPKLIIRSRDSYVVGGK